MSNELLEISTWTAPSREPSAPFTPRATVAPSKFGQAGLGAAASTTALQSAQRSWNTDLTSNINLEFGGTTKATRGLRGSDGVNTLLFNDPGNQSVPNAYSCATGGVLAKGR